MDKYKKKCQDVPLTNFNDFNFGEQAEKIFKQFIDLCIGYFFIISDKYANRFFQRDFCPTNYQAHLRFGIGKPTT